MTIIKGEGKKMKMDYTDSAIIYLIIEIVTFTVLFLLGRLVQFFLNKEKVPYIARDVNDPRIICVYIYRIQKYGSRYIDYKFMKAAGSWKPVISKKSIFGITVVALVMCGMIVYMSGIKGLVCMGLPAALYVIALSVTRYYEAYRILMRN